MLHRYAPDEAEEFRKEDLPPEIAATARVTLGDSTYKSAVTPRHTMW